MDEKKTVDVETVIIGDKAYDSGDVTPSVYFEHVKNMKEKLSAENQNIIIDSALKMLNKCKITKQTAMAKELTHQVELALQELDILNAGFEIYVSRKNLEKYINHVEGKAVKIIELSEYTREIPDDKLDIIAKASDIFDELYIIFTDYTKKEAKRVAKERRDKDPIVFGALHDKDADPSEDVYLEDKLFFITDWIDPNCDLTLEEIVKETEGKEYELLTYKIKSPKDEDEVKEYLNSFKEPVENNKPVKLFDKLKDKLLIIKKKRGRKPTTKKED